MAGLAREGLRALLFLFGPDGTVYAIKEQTPAALPPGRPVQAEATAIAADFDKAASEVAKHQPVIHRDDLPAGWMGWPRESVGGMVFTFAPDGTVYVIGETGGER